MKSDDFLVTTTVNGKSWQLVWDNEDPLELDYPVYWEARQGKDGNVVLKHLINGTEIPVDAAYLKGDREIQLPKGKGEDRQVNVTFKKVKRIRPAFLTSADAMRSVGPADRYVSAGIRENLISFKEMPDKPYVGQVVDLEIFELVHKHGKINVVAKSAGVRFKPAGGESRGLIPGQSTPLTENEVLAGAFIYGSYWWRVNKVPQPEMLDLDELDKEIQAQDLVSLQSLTKGIGAFLMLLLVVIRGIYYVNQMHSDRNKPAAITEVELKKPKIIPKIELPKPTPTPAQVAKATPTPKPIEKKEPPKVAKKEPPKKVEKKKPEPPKIVKKEPPKPVPVKKEPPKVVKVTPPPKPVALPVAPAPVKKPAPVVAKAPDPSVIAAQQKMAVAKSLNFLSTGPSKNVSALANVPSAKFNAKYANTGNGGMPATTSALNTMAKENGGDGPISTKGARNLASNSGIQGGHGKGLNEVQGKVALNSLYGNGSGEDLGAAAGAGGMTVSGPGKLSDADIEKTLAKNLDKFQRCYEKSLLSDSTLSGEVQIKWTINPNGSVSGAAVVKSEMNKKDLHDCLTGVLSKISFPAPKGGSVAVKKPFRFKSASF